MTTDTYSIQVAVDSTSAVTATRNLTAMEQATGRSERALSSLGSVAKIAGSALAGISVAALARDILRVNIEFDNLRAQLLSVTGSAVMAAKAMADIEKIARDTPQSLQEITKSYMMLKNFGIEPTTKVMQDLTNMTSKLGGNADTLSGIVRALGQAFSKSKLQAEEVNQLIERGVPVYSLLSQVTGKTTAEVLKMMEAGKLTRPVIEKLIEAMGSSATGASARSMETLGGKISNLSDAWKKFEDVLLNDKASGILGKIVSGMVASIDYLSAKFGSSISKQITELEVSVAAAKKNIPENKSSASYAAANESYMQQQIMLDQLKRQQKLNDIESSNYATKLTNDKAVQKSQDETIRLKELEIKKIKEFGTAAQQENQALKEAKDTYGEVTASMKEQIHQKYFHKDITAAQTKLTKEELAAKKEAAQASKDLAEAERYFNEQLNAQVAAAENAGKLFAAQQQTKLAGIEAEKQSIIDKASIEYQHATSYADKARILNESQNATNALLAKEKEIRDALTNQSAETIDAKIAAAQAELDNADKYNLTLAEQLRLKTQISSLQVDKAIIGETASQQDIKARADAEKKANDDRLAVIKAIDDAQTAANTASTAQMAILTANLESAKEAATGLADAFGSVGSAIGGLGVALASYEKSQAAIADGLQNQLFEIQKLNDGKGDQVKKDKAISDANQKQSQLQIKSYGDMAAAAQGFFKKGTAGYNALGLATKVFRAFEMAQSAISMAKQIGDIGKTVATYLFGETAKTTAKVTSSTASVAADTVGAGASATKAVADASQGDPYTGLARGAMMLAFMVAIGAMSGGGGGAAAATMTGADYLAKETDKYKSSQGGTVLGSEVMSNSILDALENISSNSSADLDYTKGMARSLEVLSYAMKGVSATIAKNYGVDTSSLGLGTSTSGFFMTTTTTKEFAGSGIKFVKDTLGNIVESGIIAGKNYLQTLVTKTSSGFLGIGASTKQYIATKWSPLNEEISASIAYSLGKIQENVVSLAGAFGKEAADKLKNFEIDLGKMPLGKDAAANTEIINGALSKQADLMAIIANYSYKDFQQVGEGYFQTLNRVSTAITTAQTKLKAMGITAIEYTDIINKQGDVENEMVTQSLKLFSSFADINEILGKLPGTADDKIEAFKGLTSLKESFASIGLGSVQLTQDMINVAGGISAFSSTLSDLSKSLLSPEEQLRIKTSRVSSSFESLGITMPNLGGNAQDSINTYKYILEQAAKNTTEAGKFAFVKLLALADDFASVATETAKLATDELNKTLDEFKAKQSEIAATIKTEQGNIVKSTDLLISVYKKLGEVDLASKEEALRLEREKAVRGLDAESASVTTALNNLTYIINVFNEASAGLKSAYQSLTAMRDRFVNIGDSLSAYLGDLNNTSSDYENARTLFLKTSELAKGDNEQALKDLEGVSKAFLSASKARSDAEIQAAQDSINTAKSALTSAQDALAQAQEEQAAAQLQASKDALANQKQALADQVSALKENVSTITAFKDKLLSVSKSLGSYLKELTNESQNYDAAKIEFLRIAALAKTGDEQALQDLENAAKDFLSISKTQIDDSTKIFKDAIDTSKAGLKTAYDAVVALRDKFKSIRQSLVDYKLEITGAGTPQGSPESIYRSTKKAFEDAKILAAGGNEQALTDLPSIAKSFLDASLKYNATGMDYQADYQSVLGSLDTSIAKVDSQIDILNKQLSAAESADKSLIDLNASALSIDEAIKAYKTALDSESQAASIRYEEDRALVIANASEVKANADLQITNSTKQIEKLNEQITLANTQIGKIDEQLALFTSATKSLASIDDLTSQVNNSQNALNSAMAAQAEVDTKRYEADKELVKKNVEDALNKTNEQIDIMNKQLKAAEIANASLIEVKKSTDSVYEATSALSQAVEFYIQADLTKNEFVERTAGLLYNIKTSIADSQSAIIDATAQAVATAAAASAATAAAAAQAVEIANANAAAAYADAMEARQQNIQDSLALTTVVQEVKPFANGGMANGLSLVGEQGAELINFNSPANVTSHSQTAELFDSIGNAIDDQSVLLKEQIIELKALVNLQSNANVALINEMQGMKEELNTISRKAKLEAAA
jgi:tape measure domain-containing protein